MHARPTSGDPAPEQCLDASTYVDSDHPEVVAFARRVAGEGTPAERAVQLFVAVRDGWRYDPYDTSTDPDDYRASRILETTSAWCVPKSVLLAAVGRAAGIPARLGFADVRNHLQSEKLHETMGTDLFVWHGYTELWLGGRWVKVSSAFNRELCERFGTKVLEFDGCHDALLHPFDEAGNRHMEYVRTRGSYVDLPLEEIFATFAEVYPSHADVGRVHDDAFHG